MFINILKSKIHLARITKAELYYEGSLGIDINIMKTVNILPYEKILVVNINNGERLETYAIPSPAGSKEFLLNGSAARKGCVGDRIIIMAFASLEQKEADIFKPRIIILDDKNNIIEKK